MLQKQLVEIIQSFPDLNEAQREMARDLIVGFAQSERDLRRELRRSAAPQLRVIIGGGGSTAGRLLRDTG